MTRATTTSALSFLLGALAVAREALEAVAEWGRHRYTCDWCRPEDEMDGHRPGCPALKIDAALAPGSGRLAGECLRAWIRFHLGTGPNHMEVDPLDEPGRATHALLSAFPSLREEVEGG